MQAPETASVPVAARPETPGQVIATGTPGCRPSRVAASGKAAAIEHDAGQALRRLGEPGTALVAFVDGPQRAVAAWLDHGTEPTPAALASTLEGWCTAARALLHAAQRHPDRVLLVDAALARLQRPAADAALAQWRPGLSLAAPIDDDAVGDPLALAVATCITVEAAEASALHEELQASTRPVVAALGPSPEAMLAAWQQHRARLSDGGDAGRERDLLMVQVEQLERELKRQVRKSTTAAAVVAAPASAAVAGLRVLGARDDGPHRHLQLELQRLAVGERVLPRLEARLVEHHGRVGLALFASKELPRPLGAWVPSGREGAREFMLLIPEDAADADRLARLGTSDWTLVRAAVATLAPHLAAPGPNSRPAWALAATRLDRLLADLPVRLRYDRIDVTVAPPGTDRALDIDLVRPWLHERLLGSLRLRWQPAAAGTSGSLQSLLPQRLADLPLARWPLDNAGAPAAALPLPTDRGAVATLWRALGASDRAAWLACMDALCAAADSAPEPTLPPGCSRAALIAEAAQLRATVQSVAASERRRARLAGLARRLTGRRS